MIKQPSAEGRQQKTGRFLVQNREFTVSQIVLTYKKVTHILIRQKDDFCI